MRNIIIDGRLGRNAEIKSTKDGRQYLSMTVANDIYTNGENKTEWFNVSSFNETDIKRAQYLTSGRFVIVTGGLVIEPRTNDGKLYLNMYVRATSIDMPRIGQAPGANQQAQATVSVMPPASAVAAQTPYQMPAQPQPAYQAPSYQQKPQPVQAYAPQPYPQAPAPSMMPSPAPQPAVNNTYAPPSGAPAADSGEDLPF